MAVSIKAFIQIEESLSSRLSLSLSSLSAEYLRQILPLVQRQEWAKAEAVVNSIDVSSVFEDNKAYIEYSTYAAMLFGASRLTSKPENSIIATRNHTEEVKLGTESLRRALTISVAKSMREALLVDIASAKAGLLHQDTTLVAKAPRVLKPFQSFAENADASLKLISQLHTSRVSTYGFTAEAEVLGVTRYKINEQLDNRICPICSYMHGKTFSVSDARNTITKVLSSINPDDTAEIQPWPNQSPDEVVYFKNMTIEQLVAKNWHIPPYHPHCRGILVATTEQIPLSLKPANELAVGDSGWVDWAGKLRNAERDAIGNYASSMYKQINTALRFGMTDAIPTSMQTKVKANITVLRSVFKNAPTLPASDVATIVYRGIRNTTALQEEYGKAVVGSIITDAGFVSTSRSMNQAISFGTRDAGILVEIELPTGLAVLDMSNLALNTVSISEQEVLLNAGSRFVVTGIFKSDKGLVERLTLRAIT